MKLINLCLCSTQLKMQGVKKLKKSYFVCKNETESPATRSPSEAGHKRVGTLRGEAESVQRKTSTIQTGRHIRH